MYYKDMTSRLRYKTQFFLVQVVFIKLNMVCTSCNDLHQNELGFFSLLSLGSSRGAISEFTLMTVAQSIEQRRAKSQVGGTNRIPLSRENGFTTDYIAPFFIR